ncbi:PorP/SprF family type IX secretion system membrane protein [Mariniphaga anaerophila]|nr:type IX secretion system membrane protein PorP/SprF [Mariniphaga anaerophila]
MRYRIRLNRGVLFLLLFMVFKAEAQQEPTFTQYNFNIQTFNPAYAGTWKNTGFMVIGRHQWVGMSGAPQTYTFSFQTPVKFQNFALGMNIIADKIGLEKRMGADIDYSYRIRLTGVTDLRLGIKGGVTAYTNNFTGYTGYPGDPEDPVFMTDIETRFMPNFGVGAFLHNEKYYLGISSPKILKTDFKNSSSEMSTWAELRHFFLIGGYVFDLAENLKFKPTFLARSVWGASSVVDLTANFLLGEKVWLGANYRTGDSFGFIGQWIFENQLRIGYAFDYSITPLKSFTNATHEVMVSYELPSRRKWINPRMF